MSSSCNHSIPKHKIMATWWPEEGMSELGWTMLPSSEACCHRLKGLSPSEQPGLVSTVSHSPLAPETERRELSNNSLRTGWLEREAGILPVRGPNNRRVFWFGLHNQNEQNKTKQTQSWVQWFLILENFMVSWALAHTFSTAKKQPSCCTSVTVSHLPVSTESFFHGGRQMLKGISASSLFSGTVHLFC